MLFVNTCNLYFMKGEVTMNRKDPLFIRIGEDRIRLDSIEGYGIRTITRYFVRNEAHSEVGRNIYEGAFELYMYDDEPDKSASPMLDINGYPVRMERTVVQEGHLSPQAFDVQKARALYVRNTWMGSRFSESSTLFYKEGECGFDIHAKLAELDGLLLDLQKNLPDEKNSKN